MSTKFLSFFFFVFTGFLCFSQQLQFVSSHSGEPLAKVNIFSESGLLLASSDIQGFVERNDLKPAQSSYILVYDGYRIATFSSNELEAPIVKLADREKVLETVVISPSKKSKYITVKGYFNSYMMLDKKLNNYTDGIATYVFYNETRKLKTVRVEQYRTFEKNNPDVNLKDVGTFPFGALKEPDLRRAGIIEKEQVKRTGQYKEVEWDKITRIQYNIATLQDKPFTLLGYSFFDANYQDAYHYDKESKNLRNFKEYSKIVRVKLKHKNEPTYHDITSHTTFITTEITFSDTDIQPKQKLDNVISSYSFEFWKGSSFPNMQPVFSSFFGDLKENPNSIKR